MVLQSTSTPPYIIREATRINALENTVQRIASDLSTSKDQLREVKELLLRLINPEPHTIPTATVTTKSPIIQCPDNTSRIPIHRSSTPGPDMLNEEQRQTNAQSSQRELRLNVLEVAPHRTTNSRMPVAGGGSTAEMSRSWASDDTIPVTPNTLLQNFTNNMPIGAAVSTEVSASIRTSGADQSPHPSAEYNAQHGTSECRPQEGSQGTVALHQPGQSSPCREGVSTRGMTLEEQNQVPPRGPRPRFEIGLLPRICDGALVANCLCYVLHPDKGDTIVAEGRTGGSWKSPKQKFGNLCCDGEQMVQLHKIMSPNLPLIFIEDRQPFTLMEHALVKPSGSSVYVKWHSRLLVKKPKTQQSKKTC